MYFINIFNKFFLKKMKEKKQYKNLFFILLLLLFNYKIIKLIILI